MAIQQCCIHDWLHIPLQISSILDSSSFSILIQRPYSVHGIA